MTTRAQRIEARLQERFRPINLDIVDESALHAGHSGASPAGETHFRVRVVSDHFVGLNRVNRSRDVHAALREELETGLHAIALELRTPAEAAGLHVAS